MKEQEQCQFPKLFLLGFLKIFFELVETEMHIFLCKVPNLRCKTPEFPYSNKLMLAILWRVA